EHGRHDAGPAGEPPGTQPAPPPPSPHRGRHPGGEVSGGELGGSAPRDACSLSSRHQTETISPIQCGPVQARPSARRVEKMRSFAEKLRTDSEAWSDLCFYLSGKGRRRP